MSKSVRSNTVKPAAAARTVRTRPASAAKAQAETMAKKVQLTEMLKDIRSGIEQLSTNADRLRDRFS